jgi:hypothetical protein
MGVMHPLTQNMILHCGAVNAGRDELDLVATPEPTASWTPIPHARLVEEVKSALVSQTIEVVDERHALSHNGARYFGLLQVANRSKQEDFAYVVGLRNSHDKSYPAGLVVGSRVFVCDNLAFSGEISVARKHTTNILRDLQGLTFRAVGFLAERWMDQERRIEGYKGYGVDDARAHDLIIRALDAGVISTTQVPKVINEWREPRHAEFVYRNAWSLFNGFTEVLKAVSPFGLPKRTQALHGLFDHQTGLLDRLAINAAQN